LTAELITVTYNNILYGDELSIVEAESGIIKVTVEGHALFSTDNSLRNNDKPVNSKKGNNIVCAAVSFSALTLLRSITIMAEIKPEYRIEDGLLDLTVTFNSLNAEKKNIIRVLLESFMIGMLDLNKKYPDLITIHTVTENM
jgi:uncharacterized protein YsxB (DUF464 family)